STAIAVRSAEEPASILGLESEDAAAGEALTKALRTAFQKRGLGGGQEMSLVELRLTMGCSGDDPKCLAEGGKAIEVRRLVYGSLKKTGKGGYMLQLNMLDVPGASLEKELGRPLSASDLSRDKIDATAAAIVQAMLPEEDDGEPVTDGGTLTDEPTTGGDEGDTPEPKPRNKKYVWGLDKPVPRWKAVGLGVSAGLFVVSLGTAIGLTVATRTTLRDKLVRTANESLHDVYPANDPRAGMNNPMNDVDPTVTPDICKEARSHPEDDTTHPDSVKNKKVTEVCNVADGVERGQFAAWAGTAVFGVATIAFTVLLFVKKNDSAAAAAAWRHQLRMGAAPSRSGMTFGASMKF
ncbi:MAG TPA: hypothetical protein VFG69_12640, partial [Nannocystaceae bacterium]|nr:hypothetical protein [Nannocystaceae bacterium]